MSARATYAVWRRELQVTLRAPIVYLIGGVFLAVQGIAFAGLVGALSDPRRPAPLGALLEGQLAGTLLTWALQLVVLTLLGMRTIADERRSGAWELLLTAQVSERAAVVGKWLAASTLYALLWIPTLAYLGAVALYRVDDGGWDVASVATGYAGAIAIGAALLAWAVAASAAASTPLAAGGLAFAALFGVFLAGELPAAFPALALEHPVAARVLAAISVRGQLTTLARGEVSAEGLAFVATVTVVGLSLAVALACVGRRRRREVAGRLGATALLALIGALSCALAARHPARWDVSEGRRNSLDPVTRGVLSSLPARATLTLIEPTLSALEPIYAEVARVARRMADHGPVSLRRIDPARLPGGLLAAARVAGLAPGDLASNGGVVVELAGKRRVVDRLQLVSIARASDGAPTVERLAIEQAIVGALARLAAPAAVTACATTGHDELPLESAPRDADWRLVAERLEAEGVDVRPLTIDRQVPAACDVVVVAGPARPLSPDEALAIQQHVRRGGGLLVAAASRPGVAAEAGAPVGSSLAATGLEGVLAAHGLGITAAIAVDPSLTVREIPGALLVIDGYASHELQAGFAQVRPTLWFQPRGVVADHGATSLVHAGDGSWGERDLVTAPPRKDLDDLAGPVALAAVSGSGRVIAVGSAETFTTALLAGGGSAGDLWLAGAIRFLSGKPAPTVTIAPRAPDQVRLVMTARQREAVIVLSVAVIPLAWIAAGALVLAARRRRRS